MQKKYKATGVLAASVLGAAATSLWPIPGFFGNIIHTGFLAATIGGMADWFAVTAIFRKPLGIPYKTEILIRNRQRIMEALVEFAGQDLLGTDNVMRFVAKQDLAAFLALYIEYQGKETLSALTGDMTGEILKQMNVAQVAHKIAPVIRDMAEDKIIPAVGKEVLLHLTEKEQGELLADTLLTMGTELLANEELKHILQENIGEILKKYEGEGAGRAFIMGLLGLDAAKLTDLLLEKADNWLDSVVQDENKMADFSAKVQHWLTKLTDNQTIQQGLQQQINSVANEELIEQVLNKYIAQAAASPKLIEKVGNATSDFLQEFVTNPVWQQKADKAIKEWMASELESNHRAITAIIEERLNSLSDEDLVKFTEEKVADDLQMIRINGSIVGALAGMALSVVVYLAGQVITS